MGRWDCGFKRRRFIRRRWWQTGVVAIVVAVPSVLRDVFVEIEFHGLGTFLVDLHGLWDPTVGTGTVDVERADSV